MGPPNAIGDQVFGLGCGGLGASISSYTLTQVGSQATAGCHTAAATPPEAASLANTLGSATVNAVIRTTRRGPQTPYAGSVDRVTVEATAQAITTVRATRRSQTAVKGFILRCPTGPNSIDPAGPEPRIGPIGPGTAKGPTLGITSTDAAPGVSLS